MLNWSYKGGFFGNYLCVGKSIASIAQGRCKRHPCAQSARRQRPCCRHFRRCIYSSKMNMLLTQVALVARPCAPDAQLTDDSSSSSRRFSISLCCFAPLGIEQDCSFRMPLTKSKCIDKVLRTNRFFQNKITSSKAQFRQLPKVADASQPFLFDKQSSLRTNCSQPSLRDGTMIFKNAGGVHAAVKKV